MFSRKSSSSLLPLAAVFGGLLLLSCDKAKDAAPCEISPAAIERPGRLEQSGAPATLRDLPAVGRAIATMIRPGPRYRWDSKSGFVETLDGSLLLHGAIRAPRPARLRIIVLLDYQPVEATIRVWMGSRRKVLHQSKNGELVFDAPPGVAFDIELPPQTVTTGQWREVQTYVAMAGEEPDVRRWTVHSGPAPPAAQRCERASAAVPKNGQRSTLVGEVFGVAAPPHSTLAVVPLSSTSVGAAHLVRFDTEGKGFEVKFGRAPNVVAVWPSPLGGPGPDWISNFWTIRADSSDQKRVPPDVVR